MQKEISIENRIEFHHIEVELRWKGNEDAIAAFLFPFPFLLFTNPFHVTLQRACVNSGLGYKKRVHDRLINYNSFSKCHL